MLMNEGNAMDAAVATAFALAVVHPSAGNIGGGGFLVYRSSQGEAAAYDFREKAPAAAFLEELVIAVDANNVPLRARELFRREAADSAHAANDNVSLQGLDLLDHLPMPQ